jgi:phosphoribosylglycinamide formyltransferase-1
MIFGKNKTGKKNISFLVSGRGSNFQALAEKIQNGYIKAEIKAVISDKGDAPVLEKAEKMGIKSFFIDPKKFSSRESHEREILHILHEVETDLIVAAGYMRLLTPVFIEPFRNRIINIHPSLLPAFPGKDAQAQAVEHGVKIAGCTCHFIDEGTDTGPIIMQAAVDVTQVDTAATLSQKILEQEHKILSECVKLFCEDRIKIENRKVYIL